VIPPDGEYDYRVPVASGEAGKAFEKLLTYTVKVTWSPSYKVYHYNHDFVSDTGLRLKRPLPDSNRVTGYRLDKRDSIWITEDTFAKVGTGLVVARTSTGDARDVAAAVTVAHLVTAPDTLRVFLTDDQGFPTDILESMAIKENAILYVTGRDGHNLQGSVKRMNKKKDLALVTFSTAWQDQNLRPFGFRLGRTQDLQWGNYAYVVGYPRGRAHVAGGTVSLDSMEDKFFIDALIRGGYSGGPVVVVRDGLPHLELVGLCIGTSTKKVRKVLPDRFLPTGAVVTEKVLKHLYVAEEEELEFGLGFAVGINSIRTFLLQSRNELLERGIDVRQSSYLKMWGF
jgi:hypothetical protein